MQYFPGSRCNVTQILVEKPNDETTKSELLFYLVTALFAQCLCRRRDERFALKCQKVLFGANEQVPKYPDLAPQVPYNQWLKLCQYRSMVQVPAWEMAF